MTNSSSWGNYRDTILIYNGRLAVVDNTKTNSGVWTVKTFGSSLETGTTSKYDSDNIYRDLLTTCSSEECKLKNLYDVAGNTWKWTEETAITDKVANTVCSSHRVNRGGSVLNFYSGYIACYRMYGMVSFNNFNLGFRVALYIK